MAKSDAQKAHEIRVKEKLAQKVSERARAQTAEAISKAVSKTPKVPVKAAEEAVGAAAHVPGRGKPVTPPAIHEMGMKAERMVSQKETTEAAIKQGKGRTLHTPERHKIGMRLEELAKTKRISKPIVAPKASEAITRKVAKTAAMGAKTAAIKMLRPSSTLAKPIEAAVRKVPLVGKLIAGPWGKVGRKVLGPVGSAIDVSLIGAAGYQAYRTAKEHGALRAKAEKAGVTMKRKGLGRVMLEAFSKEHAEMDPGVKVWNPKTKKWD